jgi:hypothetical protein
MKRAKIYKPDIDETYSLVNNGTGAVEAEINNGCSIKVNPEDDGFIRNFGKGKQFVKIWEGASIMMTKLKVSDRALGLCIKLVPFVSYQTGALKNGEEYLSIISLAKLLDYEEQAMRRLINELIDYSIIAISYTGNGKGKGRTKTLVANPYVFVRGCAVENTLRDDIFRNSPFRWDKNKK